MLKAVKVEALSGFKIRIWYENGVSGEVDLSELVGQGVFAYWNDPTAFKNVCIGTSGEIKWNEQIDLCPDALYMDITGKQPEEVFPNLMRAHADA